MLAPPQVQWFYPPNNKLVQHPIDPSFSHVFGIIIVAFFPPVDLTMHIFRLRFCFGLVPHFTSPLPYAKYRRSNNILPHHSLEDSINYHQPIIYLRGTPRTKTLKPHPQLEGTHRCSLAGLRPFRRDPAAIVMQRLHEILCNIASSCRHL